MNDWCIELLTKLHVRESFDCGKDSLNIFLRTQAGQNARKDISRTYVASPTDSSVVVGFYTLSSGSIAFRDLPESISSRLPRYPIPTAHVGRLAVDKRFQGRGLGGLLLVNVLQHVRDLADQIGIHAVTVRAIDGRAKTFYENFGFLPLRDARHHLFLPVATIRKL